MFVYICDLITDALNEFRRLGLRSIFLCVAVILGIIFGCVSAFGVDEFSEFALESIDFVVIINGESSVIGYFFMHLFMLLIYMLLIALCGNFGICRNFIYVICFIFSYSFFYQIIVLVIFAGVGAVVLVIFCLVPCFIVECIIIIFYSYLIIDSSLYSYCISFWEWFYTCSYPLLKTSVILIILLLVQCLLMNFFLPGVLV